MDETVPNTNQTETLAFDFRGDGFEYFKIWIVNILLSIVTLGIYSAWAKVRNNRYFYSNLYLDDNNFRYLAEPLTILKGRIISIVALVIYSFAAQTNLIAGIVLAILLFLAIPYFINQSLAFERRMSAYKNIQFRFQGSYGSAFMVLYVWPILGILTLGILYPYALLKINEYMVNNSAYGTTRFKFNANFKDYGVIFLTILGVGLVFAAFSWALVFFIPSIAKFLSPLIMALMYFGLIIYFIVATTNLFYSSLSLIEHRFESSVEMLDLTKVLLINMALIIITLGLYAPAAKVRMTRYMASCITMKASGPLDGFVAAEQQNISALGEEFGQTFDFGV